MGSAVLTKVAHGGNPQDRTFALCSSRGTPYGFVSCFKSGNPPTALTHRPTDCFTASAKDAREADERGLGEPVLKTGQSCGRVSRRRELALVSPRSDRTNPQGGVTVTTVRVRHLSLTLSSKEREHIVCPSRGDLEGLPLSLASIFKIVLISCLSH